MPENTKSDIPTASADGGRISGMTKDLGMDSNEYSISLVVFFVT